MKIEQVFSESDLAELEQVLLKSMTSTNCVMRFWLEHKKAFRRCMLGCTIILFACCIFFLFEHDKWRTLIFAICGVFAFVCNKLWNKLMDKFFNPEKLLQKYREPFVVVVEEKIIHYRESDFHISSIDHIVEYKYFLFIRADKRWYFIKAEAEEKAMLLSKLNSNSNITFTKIEEPFDLQQYIAFMEIMQIQESNRIKKYILLFIALAAVTILFFAGEKMLADGWYYIPDTAIKIASVLCLLWQDVLIIGVYSLSKRLKSLLSGWVKNIIIAITVIVTIYLVLYLAWNLFLYSISYTVKVEQYDKHIALYVENAFARTEFRYPYYMYEENWLFMRKLNDDELSKSIWKYGNPEDYYNK